MSNHNKIKTEEYELVFGGKAFCLVHIEDVGHENYFKMKLMFLNGTFREFYLSFAVMQDMKNSGLMKPYKAR